MKKLRTRLGVGVLVFITVFNFQYAYDGYLVQSVQRIEAKTNPETIKKIIETIITILTIAQVSGGTSDGNNEELFSTTDQESWPDIPCKEEFIYYYYKDPEKPTSEPISRGYEKLRCGSRVDGPGRIGFINITQRTKEESISRGEVRTCKSAFTFDTCTPISIDDCYDVGFCKY